MMMAGYINLNVRFVVVLKESLEYIEGLLSLRKPGPQVLMNFSIDI